MEPALSELMFRPCTLLPCATPKGTILSIIDLFSKRQKRLKGQVPDVYVYDDLPRAFRVQVVHIWTDVLGDQLYHDNVKNAYSMIVKTLHREYGVFKLEGSGVYDEKDPRTELANFLLNGSSTEEALDAIELSCRVIERVASKQGYRDLYDAAQSSKRAIEEINSRFREHSLGYQFVSDEIIRVDSELLHAEVVKPALRLLNRKEFAGAEAEFLAAHEHYRKGNEKEALNECLKSFESMMKAICQKRSWPYKSTATARELIDTCFGNELVPSFWQSSLTALRTLLESSIQSTQVSSWRALQ